MLRILHDTKYDFIKYWRTAVAATIAFIVLGVALMAYHKARTGRRSTTASSSPAVPSFSCSFTQAPRPADVVRAAVDKAGFVGSEVAAVRLGDRVPRQGPAGSWREGRGRER